MLTCSDVAAGLSVAQPIPRIVVVHKVLMLLNNIPLVQEVRRWVPKECGSLVENICEPSFHVCIYLLLKLK